MVIVSEVYPSRREFITNYIDKQKLTNGEYHDYTIPIYEEQTKIEPDQNEADKPRVSNKNLSKNLHSKTFKKFIKLTNRHLNQVLSNQSKINFVHDIVKEIQKPLPQLKYLEIEEPTNDSDSECEENNTGDAHTETTIENELNSSILESPKSYRSINPDNINVQRRLIMPLSNRLRAGTNKVDKKIKDEKLVKSKTKTNRTLPKKEVKPLQVQQPKNSNLSSARKKPRPSSTKSRNDKPNIKTSKMDKDKSISSARLTNKPKPEVPTILRRDKTNVKTEVPVRIRTDRSNYSCSIGEIKLVKSLSPFMKSSNSGRLFMNAPVSVVNLSF